MSKALQTYSNPQGQRPDFEAQLLRSGFQMLRRGDVQTLQINLGKLCNQACLHCHVDAGPNRTEVMNEEIADRILQLTAEASILRTIDLTVLLAPGQEDLPEFYEQQGVELVCSLPCYELNQLNRGRPTLSNFD